MNPTLVAAFWRQRYTNLFRMAILFLVVTFPLLMTLAVPAAGLTIVGDATGIVLVLAIGAIGQDLSSGVLNLLFARPVRRWEYVMSRWIAIASGAVIVSTLQVAAVVAIMYLRGAAPESNAVIALAAQRAFACFGISATLIALSSLFAGVGDVALWVVVQAIGGLLNMAGQAQGMPVLVRIGEEMGRAMTPAIAFEPIQRGLSPWLPIAAYLSTITLALWVAVVVINRREISYASAN